MSLNGAFMFSLNRVIISAYLTLSFALVVQAMESKERDFGYSFFESTTTSYQLFDDAVPESELDKIIGQRNRKNRLYILKNDDLENLSKKVAPELQREISHHLGYDDARDSVNVAAYSITFYLYLPGVGVTNYTYSPKDLFVSGARYTEGGGNEFRLANKLRLATHDHLSRNEFKTYTTMESDRGIYLGKILENKFRENLVGGCYRANSCHSEPSLLLHLKDQLDEIIEEIKSFAKAKYEEKYRPGNSKYVANIKNIKINQTILNIFTHYKPCGHCQTLISNFNQNLKNFIENAVEQKHDCPITFNKNFGTRTIALYREIPKKALDQFEHKVAAIGDSVPFFNKHHVICFCQEPHMHVPPQASLPEQKAEQVHEQSEMDADGFCQVKSKNSRRKKGGRDQQNF